MRNKTLTRQRQHLSAPEIIAITSSIIKLQYSETGTGIISDVTVLLDAVHFVITSQLQITTFCGTRGPELPNK